MLTRYTIFIYIGFLILSNPEVRAQDVKELFRSESILELNLYIPVKEVLKDRKERNKHKGILSYTNVNGQVVEIGIKTKVRGNSRTQRDICAFPPLQLTFDKAELKNTLFEGQKKLKLVTHCKNEYSFEQYLQKEYIVYKLYQKVSPYSFKVRLCKITYIDTDNPRKKQSQYGFFIEDIKDVAKRNGLHELKDSVRIKESIQQDALDKLMLFQFMIGNHDWSIQKKHNMKLIIGDDAQLPIAVPYDFDYCGLVDTPYAVPPTEIGLNSVKDRYFRGFCRYDGYKGTIDFYKDLKDPMLDEIKNSGFLSGKNQNEMIYYLNGFFDDMDNPKYVDRKISKACKVKHKHKYM